MLGHDNPAKIDMTIKGGYENKTYIGPGPTPKGNDDREVVSFDGKVLMLKWVDPEVAGRYGIHGAGALRRRAGGSGRRTARAKRPNAAPAADPPPQPQ